VKARLPVWAALGGPLADLIVNPANRCRGLKGAGVAGAPLAEEVAWEPSQRPVVLVDFVEIPMPEPVLATGAGGPLGLPVEGHRDVLALLALRRVIGAGAQAGLQILDV
jgi:hypothetical protein